MCRTHWLLALVAIAAAISTAAPAQASEILSDGGFEGATRDTPASTLASPDWAATDTFNTTPLCDASCFPMVAPRSGSVYARFGGNAPAGHTASLAQQIPIPRGAADLRFFVKRNFVAGTDTATLTVTVDGTTVATIIEGDSPDAFYTQQHVVLDAFADGAVHTLQFAYDNPVAEAVLMTVDDVSIDSPGISLRDARADNVLRPSLPPYPDVKTATNLPGTIADVNIRLTAAPVGGLAHTFPDDVDMLLVGPEGQQVMLMSDAGGGTDVTNAEFTFDDEAANALPDGTSIAGGGMFRPTDFDAGTDPCPSDAQPAIPAGTQSPTLAAFDPAGGRR